MDTNEYNVPQSEALAILGRDRVTLFQYRRSGLPYYRHPETGRIFFRRTDIEKLKNWLDRPPLKKLFQP